MLADIQSQIEKLQFEVSKNCLSSTVEIELNMALLCRIRTLVAILNLPVDKIGEKEIAFVYGV